MKKTFILLAMAAGLSACLPYNSYYAQQPGYYPNASYNLYQNQQDSQAALYSHNYDQTLDMNDDRDLDTLAMMQQSAIPVREVRQQTVYQELPQNPMYQNSMQQSQGLVPYYNPALVEQNSRGVVGVGQAMSGQTVKSLPVNSGYDKEGTSKLILPNAWRMAHPSIGKGLELTNQQERLELNLALNSANIKDTKDIKVNGIPVAIISLANSSTANSQGFLCKDVYLVKANKSGIERMWSKFCRHPNWNEWVLTAW